MGDIVLCSNSSTESIDSKALGLIGAEMRRWNDTPKKLSTIFCIPSVDGFVKSVTWSVNRHNNNCYGFDQSCFSYQSSKHYQTVRFSGDFKKCPTFMTKGSFWESTGPDAVLLSRLPVTYPAMTTLWKASSFRSKTESSPGHIWLPPSGARNNMEKHPCGSPKT